MGMNSEMWGSEGWFFLHMVAVNYPEQPTEKEKRDYRRFFESLVNVLPCPICGVHLAENMANNPIKLDSRNELFSWTVDIHNAVNAKNGKEIISYEKAYDILIQKAYTNYNKSKNEKFGSGARWIMRRVKNNKIL